MILDLLILQIYIIFKNLKAVFWYKNLPIDPLEGPSSTYSRVGNRHWKLNSDARTWESSCCESNPTSLCRFLAQYGGFLIGREREQLRSSHRPHSTEEWGPSLLIAQPSGASVQCWRNLRTSCRGDLGETSYSISEIPLSRTVHGDHISLQLKQSQI